MTNPSTPHNPHDPKHSPILQRIISSFQRTETIISIILSTLIVVIVITALLRVVVNAYNLILVDFFSPEKIEFEDYTGVFGKIMTLLISLEFMNSILRVVKTHDIKRLATDVVLIAALALCRKLIILDYHGYEALHIFSFGFILMSLAIFYFLVIGRRQRARR
ncbi:MAG: phosphate-starvation-inducible PsiE family protein [Flavobacteriales bacterium]|nr:phosphate-starvation-inducible PsiE family protein [Flavobacteriales bacterium]